MPTRHYNVGPVKPWVQQAADTIGGQFNIGTIYGFGAREGVSDHPLGLALDFMVYGDSTKGTELAHWVEANAKAFNVTYIIWQQHIWNISRASEGWRLMPDRGSATANHMDHVHVSFQATAPGSSMQGPFKPAPEPGWEAPGNPLGGLTNVLAWIGNSHNWYRIFLMLAGAALIGFALLKFDSVQSAVSAVGKVGKV